MIGRGTQRLLIGAQGLARRSGLLDGPVGRWVYGRLYGLYKQALEGRALRLLERHLSTGATAIDVGAHVGFYTVAFAARVGPSGHVLAIEPDPVNLTGLRAALAKAGVAERVEVIAAACTADAKGGKALLARDPDNPANHRVADHGLPVAAVSIDALMAERGLAPPALIKIDVQGGEPEVLAGAAETLARHRPVLFVEIDEAALAASGHDAEALTADLQARGYRLYSFVGGRLEGPLVDPAALRAPRQALGYADYLCLAEA